MKDEPSFYDFEKAGWEKASVVAGYHNQLSVVTRQSISSLLDAANVRSGNHVLDVATGAGYVAYAATQRGAKVVGIDFSAAQVRLAHESYPDIQFERADAERIPFEAATFDSVVNGFGMCHFPDPAAALRDALRVLRPGGKVAFSVWDKPARAVGFGAVYSAIGAHGTLAVGLPAGPNFFLLSDPDVAMTMLQEEGFESPTFEQVEQTWTLNEPDALFQAVCSGSVRAAATVAAQSVDAIAAIRSSLSRAVTSYRFGTGFALPMHAVIYSAVKPN
ncbi:MAG: methyltransferase domain-containing protein [Burkholderiaceae bacterium]